MGVKRSDQGGDQRHEHCNTAVVSRTPGVQGKAWQGRADPQTEGQDNGRDDQAWQQLPIAELTHFIKCPDARCQENGH